MSKKKKISIIICAIVILVISIGGIVVYKNIHTTKQIEKLSTYVEEYKTEINDYIIEQHKEKYDELISKSNELINNKDTDNIGDLKEKFKKLKDEIIQVNLELINSSISELEAIDLSKLEEKELIEEKIAEIKNLKENHKFKEASEISITLSSDVNKKLEIIRLEEAKRVEEEKKKAEEEENKKKEDTINNICGKYQLIEENEKGFVKFNMSIEISKGEGAIIIVSGQSHAASAGTCNYEDHKGSVPPIDHMRCISYFSNSIDGELELVNDNSFSGFIINANQDSTKHNILVVLENNNLRVNIDTGMTAGTKILLKVTDFENLRDRLKPLYN